MQRHSRLLAEHLARRGDVELIVLHPHRERVFDPSLRIVEVPVEPMDEKRLYLRELWRYSDRVAQALDRIQPDVIMSQGFCVWKGAERFRGRTIVHPHGLEMFQGLTTMERLKGLPFRMALRHMVRRSAVTISLGGKLTGLLNKMVAGSKSRVVVLPNAVEVPPVPPSYPVEDLPVKILFVGRFAFNKGIDLLLGVAKRLVAEGREGDFRFVLAGDGPERANMEAEGVPTNVSLAGRVDDDRLMELYTECHALALPTRFEGMPTVVLEAMARARPVFVTDVGASAELVSARNGRLLPPGDAEALYRAFLEFAELDRSKRELLGMEGYRLAADRFQWGAVSNEYFDLFWQVAEGERGEQK